MKQVLKNKTRMSNFPEHISENLVKFYYKAYKNQNPKWKENRGDLTLGNIQIEVKASINLEKTLISFGPNEYFDIIYFVDCKDIVYDRIKIYECNLSFNSDIWQNLKINQKQTFKEQCEQKRRPRIKFVKLQEQLTEHVKLIFDDSYLKLRPVH